MVREYKQYIGGEWVGADRLYDDLDPYLATVVARVPAGTRQHAKRAVDAAGAAFPAWADLPPAEKQALFLKAADIVDRRSAEIVSLLAEETRCYLPTDQRGFALARRIESGVVHVNDQTVADEPQLPLGGIKDSGWGNSGPMSMKDFTEVQWITTREGTGHYPIWRKVTMPVIVVTRLRLRDPALFDDFFASAVAVTEQAQKSGGNLGANVLAEANNTYWTSTSWQGREPMNARSSGPSRT